MTPASKKATHRRHAPEVRRALIIAAAQDAIVEDGFPATSARVIAARCGISLGTLTYHFGSIEALLVEALRDASEQMTADINTAAEQETGAINRLRRIVDDALPDRESSKRNWRLWLEYWARAAHSPELAALHSERYAAWRSLVLKTITDGIEGGELAVENPELTTLRLVALVDGLGLQSAIGDKGLSIAEARSILYETIDSLAPALRR